MKQDVKEGGNGGDSDINGEDKFLVDTFNEFSCNCIGINDIGMDN